MTFAFFVFRFYSKKDKMTILEMIRNRSSNFSKKVGSRIFSAVRVVDNNRNT